MRKAYTYLFVIIAFGLLLSSCGKDSSCFKSSGNEITELRSITADVTKIVLEDNIDLYIIQDSVPSLKLEGGKNLLPYINTDVNGTELKITSDNKCDFFRDYNMPLTAYLSIPNLELIEYSGQGTISNLGTLQFSDFSIDSRNGTGTITLKMNSNKLAFRQHSGPADFNISGTTNEAYFYTLGNGWMHCENLVANSVHVNHAGSGDVTVNAITSLLVELTSTGNINYYGNPTVTVSVHSGSGQLNHK